MGSNDAAEDHTDEAVSHQLRHAESPPSRSVAAREQAGLDRL